MSTYSNMRASMLRVKLFGTPQIYLNHQCLTKIFKPQSLALFSYLIMAEKPQDRTTLAQTLWPNSSLWRAKNNLRYQVCRLQLLLGNYVVGTPTQLSFNHKMPHWLDVKVFADLATSIALHTGLTIRPLGNAPSAKKPDIICQLLDLYVDDFMARFKLEHSPIFEEWAMKQRVYLQTLKEQIMGNPAPSKPVTVDDSATWLATNPTHDAEKIDSLWRFPTHQFLVQAKYLARPFPNLDNPSRSISA